jgi:hypothetical protein
MSDISGCASTNGDGTLGVQSINFDGFSLIQAHSLCTDTTTLYLEASSHIQLMNAFLTSWLSPAIAIAGYEDEILVTGEILTAFYS